MSTGIVTVSELIDQVREEADLQSSQFVTDFAIATHLNNSYKEFYDKLTGAYGEDYYAAIPVTITTDGVNDKYALPDGTLYSGAPAFYKLLGVDMQVSSGPQGLVTLTTFPFSERNKLNSPAFVPYLGRIKPRYRLLGNQLWLNPLPPSGQQIVIWYVPRPTNIVSSIIGTLTNSSQTVNVTDVTTPQVGMQITGAGIPTGTTITAVGVNTITISQAATASSTNIVLKMFSYTQTIDGVSGWEEYPVVDVAIKCKDKEESDVSVLIARKEGLVKRLDTIAANRDQGSAGKTADVMADNWNGDPNNGGAY